MLRGRYKFKTAALNFEIFQQTIRALVIFHLMANNN